jgi:hypothetical protein
MKQATARQYGYIRSVLAASLTTTNSFTRQRPYDVLNGLLRKHNATSAFTESQAKSMSMSGIVWSKYEDVFPYDFLSEAAKNPQYKTIKGTIYALDQSQLSVIRKGLIERKTPQEEVAMSRLYNMLRHELKKEDNGTVRAALGACVEAMVDLDKATLEVARKD